jgi:hypothetical protein
VTLEAFLTRLAEALRAADTPAMLTGSVAAAYLGALRSTLDVDVVIDPTPEGLERLVDAIEATGWYVSRDAAREALAERSMFNVIDGESGWKADLIVRKHRTFSASEFARRQPLSFGDGSLDIVRLEDLILAKLEWAREGASARQLEDAKTLCALAGDTLDVAYIAEWATTLHVESLWRALRDAPDA